MRLGSTYDKVTHRNIKQCFHFHTCLQSEGAGMCFRQPWLVGSISRTGAKLLLQGGANAAAHPIASVRIWELKPYTGDLNQDFSKKQRQKALTHISNLNCWLCICNNIIPSPIPRPLSGGLVCVLAFIAKLSFQFCT